jgi:hypothetical protein
MRTSLLWCGATTSTLQQRFAVPDLVDEVQHNPLAEAQTCLAPLGMDSTIYVAFSAEPLPKSEQYRQIPGSRSAMNLKISVFSKHTEHLIIA